jgi:hypothetical protein
MESWLNGAACRGRAKGSLMNSLPGVRTKCLHPRTSSIGSMPSRQLCREKFPGAITVFARVFRLENANNLARGFRNGNSRLQ